MFRTQYRDGRRQGIIAVDHSPNFRMRQQVLASPIPGIAQDRLAGAGVQPADQPGTDLQIWSLLIRQALLPGRSADKLDDMVGVDTHSPVALENATDRRLELNNLLFEPTTVLYSGSQKESSGGYPHLGVIKILYRKNETTIIFRDKIAGR